MIRFGYPHFQYQNEHRQQTPEIIPQLLETGFLFSSGKLLNLNQRCIWKSNCFLTSAHSCFLDNTLLPQSNENRMQLIQNLSLHLWLFPAEHFQSKYILQRRWQLHISSNCQMNCQQDNKDSGDGEDLSDQENHIAFRLPVELLLTLLPAEISATQNG